MLLAGLHWTSLQHEAGNAGSAEEPDSRDGRYSRASMMTVRGEEDEEHKDEDDHILRRRRRRRRRRRGRRRRGTVVLPSTVVDVDAVDDLMTMAVPGAVWSL